MNLTRDTIQPTTGVWWELEAEVQGRAPAQTSSLPGRGQAGMPPLTPRRLHPTTSGYQEFPEGWPLSDSPATSTGAEHHTTAIAVTAQHPKLCSRKPSCPPFHSRTPFRPSYSQGRAFLQTQ